MNVENVGKKEGKVKHGINSILINRSSKQDRSLGSDRIG